MRKYFLFSLFALALLLPFAVHAQQDPGPGFPITVTGQGGASSACPDGQVCLINPLGTTDPRIIIGNLIKAILSIIGSITLLMFVYGGVLWITSMGEEKKVQKGKQILVWGVLGLALIAGSYVLVNAIITGLATGSVI